MRCYMLLYEALSRLLLQTTNIAIIDMGLIWRAAMPSTSEREAPGGTRLTWRWYAENMLNLILNIHPGAKEIHLINDRYDVKLSVNKRGT